MSICYEKNLHALPPTELWLEQPATVRERTGSGSAKGMAAGMHTQTVLLAPPSTPRMTLPMRGLWHSSMSHISLAEYLCILLCSASPSCSLQVRPHMASLSALRRGERDEGGRRQQQEMRGK